MPNRAVVAMMFAASGCGSTAVLDAPPVVIDGPADASIDSVVVDACTFPCIACEDGFCQAPTILPDWDVLLDQGPEYGPLTANELVFSQDDVIAFATGSRSAVRKQDGSLLRIVNDAGSSRRAAVGDAAMYTYDDRQISLLAKADLQRLWTWTFPAAQTTAEPVGGEPPQAVEDRLPFRVISFAPDGTPSYGPSSSFSATWGQSGSFCGKPLRLSDGTVAVPVQAQGTNDRMIMRYSETEVTVEKLFDAATQACEWVPGSNGGFYFFDSAAIDGDYVIETDGMLVEQRRFHFTRPMHIEVPNDYATFRPPVIVGDLAVRIFVGQGLEIHSLKNPLAPPVFRALATNGSQEFVLGSDGAHLYVFYATYVAPMIQLRLQRLPPLL